MSGGIFYLDEDRDKESPSPSPRPSPRQSPTLAATDPRASPSPTSFVPTASTLAPPTLHLPASGPSNLPNNQPQGIARKHTVPFAATPSFPSPLAQAITVPTHSDTSSSGSHSDDDVDAAEAVSGTVNLTRSVTATPVKDSDPILRSRTASPHTSRSGSPSSTQKSLSRPPSPKGVQQLATPGTFLMKPKRSSSGSLLAGTINTNVASGRDASSSRSTGAKISPTHPGSRRLSKSSRNEPPHTALSLSRRRGSSESTGSLSVPQSVPEYPSPLAFGSPEMEPIRAGDESPTRNPISNTSSPRDGKDSGNSLGLGWSLSAWETSSATGSSPGSYKDKGKIKEVASGPPSPRVSQRDRERPTSTLAVASPPRHRRPSEFLNPFGDSRKMPIVGGPRASISAAHVSSLSTSASMISPLNPLPSPWTDNDLSPFSPPKSQSSELPSSTSTSSISSSAMRLNRVPTSVRMAAELIKNTTPGQINTSVSTPTSTGDSAITTASVPTPNSSPAGSLSDPSNMRIPPSRALGGFSSLPIAASQVSPDATLTVGPSRKTPSPPDRKDEAPFKPSPTRSASSKTEIQRKPSSTALAPPSAFKTPLPQQSKGKTPSSLDIPSAVKSHGSATQIHRYRTSMHEPNFKRPVSLLSDASTLVPTVSADAALTDSSIASSKPPSFGLGLNLPQSSDGGSGSGSMTPDLIDQSRQRSSTGKLLQMDLAGFGHLGDAASHASMIMQSRQAKVQRWRPNSGGKQSGQERLLPPAFNRSTTTGAPAMLAAPRVGRQDQWGGVPTGLATAASSPGEDLPPFPSALGELGRVDALHVDPLATQFNDPSATIGPIKSNAGPSRFIAGQIGSTGMERQASGGGSTIGGIEWVDWYDCYKGYKEAKIRAEEAARKNSLSEHSPLTRTRSALPSTSTSPIAEDDEMRGNHREIDLISTYDASSAIALTPQTSRDELSTQIGSMRRRSLSIRSVMSLDPSRSPTQKRPSIFERPRQTSGSSAWSAADSIGGQVPGKRKKNLVTKMEGWWNAVKSNFVPEGQYPHPHRPARPSNLAVYPSQRVPSAPISRRGSDMSTIATPQGGMLAPQSLRRESTQSVKSIRQITSHNEMRPRVGNDHTNLQAAAPIVTSTSADIAHLQREALNYQPSSAPLLGRTPSTVPEEASRMPSRVPSSLEARRKGLGMAATLRLELESNVLVAKPDSHQSSESTSERQSHLPNHLVSPQASSRSSSYGQSNTGPGLTPGVPRWDVTPSPIYPVSTASRDEKEERPVAPGAEITVASVQRHIKHRLNAAKQICDATLKKAIDAMTKFADEQKEKQLQAEMDEPLDYFDALSDSPLVDAEESEMEGGDMFDGGPRSRHASTSRPPSRRPSVSRPINMITASPTKRLAMLPSSPSRVRRRPSVAPRSFPNQRMPRNASLSLDKSVSAASSRSTSRSRSPMPTSTRGLLPVQTDEELEENRTFLAALQDLIVLATEVMDSSVTSLIAKSGVCAEIVQKLQKIGQNWDEHYDWPGREWYVDILMAVANLSRVLDWWQAEKGFWNFDEEDDNEPIFFVMKPPGQGKEESRFDREFGEALSDHRGSTATHLLQIPEPPANGVMLEVPSPDSSVGGTARQMLPAANHGIGSDDLKFLADHAKSVNIVMELSLQGEEILYVNDAILEVTGRDPEDVLNVPITELLAPADAALFADATQKLIEDDHNTVQLRFRFEVHELEKEAHPPLQPGPVYVELEGVGMLMRERDEPSHTMWVLKPVTATRLQVDTIGDFTFPREGVISTEGILCRICEREIVTWFFEKHNETCDAVHRLEAEITGCDECLHDLHQTVVQLVDDIDDATVGNSPQYSGVLFFSLPDSITAGHESTVPVGPQGVEVRKVVRDSLQGVASMLAMAQQIEIPSVQEDEADLPFNVQRYLSRESEEKLQRITKWQRPVTEDRALSLLFAHVEEQLRRKQKAIARMQSTIRYSEKTRHEWEDKVNRIYTEGDEGSPSESGSDIADPSTSPTEAPPEAAELSAPGPRKIAPQARLPITQSHPQRPVTSHGESMSSDPNTPAVIGTDATAADDFQPPNSAPLPSESTLKLLTLAAPVPSKKRVMSDSIPLSPLLTPLDVPMGHARRASSSKAFRDAPLSPRIPSAALQTRAAQPSIKDFEIIKPISRGAFGSVYLAKKVATGDYFAIKALKKSDMIAKNQITNVKAERTILMNQASSPYVAKLFFSFQSKEYLYLVMEYLNGGDCATLVKTLGGLPEEWARNYTAEVVLGLEYLHARNIVHRDIKPDNLLIDARGHLKLTDFGLSRIGLLNRQVGGPRPAYLRGTNLRGSLKRRPTGKRNDSSSSASPSMSPELLPAQGAASRNQSYFAGIPDIDTADDSSGSESAGIIPRHMRTMSMANKATNGQNTPPRFVGTPDYLAPESILGIGTDDKVVDWWALGVVLYEFIYGVPPFHAESPEKVFDNVVSRRIDWHEDEMEISPAARDLMDRLMCSDPLRRLGARGADEVKQHAFFAGIDWNTIATSEASFVPEVTDPESTDYFDPRGAAHTFLDDEAIPQVLKNPVLTDAGHSPTTARDMSAVIDDMASQDDFGTFNFKNLPVLKQANDDVIRKLRTDSMAPIGQTLQGTAALSRRPRSLSIKLKGQGRRKASDSTHSHGAGFGPPSPSTSISSAASTPSRASIPPSTPGSIPFSGGHHFRRPSELNALERVKSSQDSDVIRRASAPSRVRAGSGSSISERSTHMGLWRKKRQVSLNSEAIAAGEARGMTAPLESPESHASFGSMGDRTLDVLIAEDNPISQKILETLLTRMGCRCICVEDGPQALAATMGGIRFDVIICDIHMPVVSGEQVARMIRSTNNHNQNTPIIAATSYEQHQSITEEGTLFSAVLAKPVTKADLIKCLAKLGFILTSAGSQTASDAVSSGIPG